MDGDDVYRRGDKEDHGERDVDGMPQREELFEEMKLPHATELSKIFRDGARRLTFDLQTRLLHESENPSPCHKRPRPKTQNPKELNQQ